MRGGKQGLYSPLDDEVKQELHKRRYDRTPVMNSRSPLPTSGFRRAGLSVIDRYQDSLTKSILTEISSKGAFLTEVPQESEVYPFVPTSIYDIQEKDIYLLQTALPPLVLTHFYGERYKRQQQAETYFSRARFRRFERRTCRLEADVYIFY